MTETVWLVSTGSYSDYSVVGVFSSKKNAEEFMKRLDQESDWNPLEEMIVDAPLPQLRAGLIPWFVEMERDGSTRRVEERELGVYECRATASIWRRSQAPAYRGQGLSDLLHVTAFASDKKHAVKIANEIRAQMIANGEWDRGLEE